MNEPKTVYEILQMLEDYHATRLVTYQDLAKQTSDAMAQIFLEHLVELEEHSLQVVRLETQQLDPRHTTFLTSGPTLSNEVTHAKECQCESTPSFQDALSCALTSDHLLDQLLHRLEGCSAAPSVLHLAERLRELEETKDVQVAKFTRMD